MPTQTPHTNDAAAPETRLNVFARLPFTKKIFVAFLGACALLVLLWLLSYIFSAFGYGSHRGYYGVTSSGGMGVMMQKGMPARDFYAMGGIVADEAVSSPYPSPMPPEYNAGGSGEIEEVFSEERRIIKNASLSMIVENADSTSGKIQSIAKENKGFVENAYMYETGVSNEKRGSLSVRVPEDAFEAALTAIKALAREVTSEQISASDVTEQAVDLEARLENERRSEAQYQNILEKADTTDEILKVQRELNRVRGTIEQLDAQLQNLSRSVRMATISVELSSVAEGKVGALTWKPLNEVKAGIRALAEGLIAFGNAFIAFIFMLPILALWLLIVGGVGYVAYRFALFIKKKFFPTL